MSENKEEPSVYDASFVKPFVNAVTTTLKVQCSVESKILKPFIRGDKETTPTEIAAVIGIVSDTYKGTVALYFSSSLFLTLMSNMLGEAFTEITKDIEDGAGELLNIIFGHAKKVLNNEGHTLQKAIPYVVRGSSSGNTLQARHITRKPVVVLPFNTPHGDLFMEISKEEIAFPGA